MGLRKEKDVRRYTRDDLGRWIWSVWTPEIERRYPIRTRESKGLDKLDRKVMLWDKVLHALECFDELDEKYKPVALQAFKKIEKYGIPSYYFITKAPEIARRMDKATTRIPDRDRFLLEYIHDLKSAGIVSQLIDLQKYGKEYAQKCGRFY